MSNIFLSQKLNKDKLNLQVLEKITKMYNKLLYQYTKSFSGRIPVPKTDISKIPKKYITVNEYIQSKSVWKQILKFMKEAVDLDLTEYLNVMFRNWYDISLYINMPDRKIPLSSIIFSTKMIPMFYKFKEKERLQHELNKHLLSKRSEDFYRLTPSLQSNINSLFKLKSLNSNISYHEILDIFRGEFEQEFIDKVKELDESEITPENLALIFNC